MAPNVLHGGIGKADITPAIGTPMGGFANRVQPCQGVLDPLSARALLLTEGDTTSLLITLDALAISARQADSLRAEAARACAGALQPRAVHISCSHTHSGADLPALFGYDDRLAAYEEQVRVAIVLACRQASARLLPVTVAHGSSAMAIGKNRRFRPNHAHPTEQERAQGYAIDHTLTTLRLLDAVTGRAIAILFHTACHPVCLGPENCFASGDYAGIAAQLIEQQTGAPAMFLNGACGNVTPIIGRGSTYTATRNLAQSIADAITTQTLHSSMVTHPIMALSGSMRADLPLTCHFENAEQINQEAGKLDNFVTGFGGWAATVDTWRQRMLEMLAAGSLPTSVPVPVSAMRIGDTCFVFIGAEVFNEYQLRQPPDVRVVGYTDGCVGYIPTTAALAGGGYEVESAPVVYGLPCPPGPDAEPVLRAAIAGQIALLRRS